MRELYQKYIFGFTVAILALVLAPSSEAGQLAKQSNTLQRDFMRVVMAAEFGGSSKFARSVKKFNSSVRFSITNHAAADRRQAVRSFVWKLPQKIRGLRASVVSNPNNANFRIHVVDRDQYADVIREKLYGGRKVTVRGRCFVRVTKGPNAGIGGADAVIVSDMGEGVFQRCLVEEVLQGLGPLADRGHQAHSIFNTRSKHKRFTRYDQVLLNTLYDPRIKAGMSRRQVAKVLPDVMNYWITTLDQ